MSSDVAYSRQAAAAMGAIVSGRELVGPPLMVHLNRFYFNAYCGHYIGVCVPSRFVE